VGIHDSATASQYFTFGALHIDFYEVGWRMPSFKDEVI
jgi:hypothetical protein